MKALLWLTAILILGLGVSGQTAKPDIETATPDGKIVILKADGTWVYKTVTKGKVLGITAAGYAAMENGMSIADVVAIIGSQGEITSDSNSFETRTVSIEWKPAKAVGYVILQTVFQGNKLMSKSHIGLK